MKSLFETVKAGDLILKNRLVMAPLTRCRASGEDGRTPNDLMVEYYKQRSGAGLILTEATSVDPMGVGYPHTPGLWSEEHVLGWKKITDAVHENKGTIVAQLWHVGRISDPYYLNGELPVAPSALKPSGRVSLVRPEKEYVTPRALEKDEIIAIVQQYKNAALNAKKAGFDGIEIHAANGYLIDQFMQDSTNKRNDLYGGSIENRSRFLLEIVDQCSEVFGYGRIGVHLAPRMDSHDMGDSNPKALFGYVAKELGKRKIAFIFTREHLAEDQISDYIKEEFGGFFIRNEKIPPHEAEALVTTNRADAVSFGVQYIANPDLDLRLKNNSPLNTPNPQTFYAVGTTGYTDYPFYKE